MKLYLVADYPIHGRRFAAACTIDGSSNLAHLTSLASLRVPAKGGGFVAVAPTFIQMCESGKKAAAVAESWNAGYGHGEPFDFAPVDPEGFHSGKEVA